nr:hypothetical protein [Tanacetum cinerariifolium]
MNTVAATTTQRSPVVNQRVLTCFECGRQGHYRNECLKLKNQTRLFRVVTCRDAGADPGGGHDGQVPPTEKFGCNGVFKNMNNNGGEEDEGGS